MIYTVPHLCWYDNPQRHILPHKNLPLFSVTCEYRKSNTPKYSRFKTMHDNYKKEKMRS